MKIAYLVDEDLAESPGVLKKITRQVKFWSEKGHEVAIFELRKNSEYYSKLSRNQLIKFFQKFYRRLASKYAIIKELKHYAPDLIYSRYILYIPGLARSLKDVAPYVLEINTDDKKEFAQSSKVNGLYNLLTRGDLLNNAKGLIFVTNELRDIFLKRDISGVVESVVIANSYDFSISSNVCLDRTIGNIRYRVIFVGTDAMPWHGVDKILDLAKFLEDVDFIIVGIESKKYPNASKNVIFCGQVNGKNLHALLLSCDVAISSVALHRAGINHACPLKSREYLAFGLPMILGYIDPDVNCGESYVLSLPNEENNLSDAHREIEEFICNSRMFSKALIREASEKVMDVRVKEQQRLDFLSKVF